MKDKALEQNIDKAEQYLKRFRDGVTGHWVNGAPWAGEVVETFDNLTPVDNTSLGRIAAGTGAEVDVGPDI